MSAVVQIADRAGLLANWPLLAGKSRIGFSLQTSHPENAMAGMGQRGGIRAVGQEPPVKYSNKVTFKGQLCAVSCQPAQHRSPVA